MKQNVSSLYKTAGFISENVWGTLSATTHAAVSRVYTRLYETRASRYLIRPYCSWQYRDRDHHLKFRPGRGKKHYESFQDFFTRDFKAPLKIKSSVAWPCEGVVCDLERSISNKCVDVKGDSRPIRSIFGKSGHKIPKKYSFINIFLHNKNYHHIHAPVSGTITDIERIPGKLLLLRPYAYPGRPSLPAFHNERVNITLTDSRGRPWFLSIVGGPAVATVELPQKVKMGGKIKIGEKLASFLMGSTCCIAAPLIPHVSLNEEVFVGHSFE